MQALEFSTIIEKGIIRIPLIYQAWESAKVKVILLAEHLSGSPIRKKTCAAFLRK